jgi:hypothetical protein
MNSSEMKIKSSKKNYLSSYFYQLSGNYGGSREFEDPHAQRNDHLTKQVHFESNPYSIQKDNMNYLKELIHNYELEIVEMKQRYDKLFEDRASLETSYYYLLNDNNALINQLEDFQRGRSDAYQNHITDSKEKVQNNDPMLTSVSSIVYFQEYEHEPDKQDRLASNPELSKHKKCRKANDPKLREREPRPESKVY